MSSRIATVSIAIVLSAASVWAADIDGRWTGAADTPDGAITLAFAFKADGTALSGTMTAMAGNQVPIKNGRVDGNKIAFDVTVDYGGMPVVLAYSGLVRQDSIELTGDFMGMPFQLTLSRAR